MLAFASVVRVSDLLTAGAYQGAKIQKNPDPPKQKTAGHAVAPAVFVFIMINISYQPVWFTRKADALIVI